MELRSYCEGDEKKILGLFDAVFKRKMEESSWRWRYLDNPYGKGIIRLMFDGEEIVGHYAVIPIPLMVDGKHIRAALSMSTMTHPDYGKQGVFTSLASEVYSACERKGIRLVTGFANKNSYHGLTNKLGWIGFGQIIYCEMTDYGDIGRVDNNYRCVETTVIGEEMDELWEKLKRRYVVIVPRDSKYLNWRFLNNPIERYTVFYIRDGGNKLQGYMVLKMYQSEKGSIGHIVDIIVSETASAIVGLIYTACEYFNDNNVGTVAIWAHISSPIRDTLRQLGFIERKWVGYASEEWPTYFGIKTLGVGGEPMNNIKNLRNWYITMGDSDVF